MTKYLCLFLMSFLLYTCGSTDVDSTDGEATTPTDESTAATSSNDGEGPEDRMISEGWTALFDGDDLSAWRGYNMEEVAPGWAAKDGELQFTPGDGNGGDLITRERYLDFEFQLEYQLIEGGNSGIFYLVKEVEGLPIYFNAPEYQLLDDEWWARERDETPIHFTSANYDLQAPEGVQLNPIGEWNTAKIVKRGNTIQHYHNGILTVEYELDSPEWTAQYEASKFKGFQEADYAQTRIGNLGLQDHGEFVRFRNIYVKKL